MKKIFLIALSFCVAIVANSQTKTFAAGNLQARDSIYINGKWIVRVLPDIATDSTANNALPTVKAVRDWVATHGGAGGTDGNNYPSVLSIASQILRLQRAGLSDLTVTIDKAAVGLGSVDNTTDAGKPISTAQAVVNALKLNIADTAGKWVSRVTKNGTGDSIIIFIGASRFAIKDSVGAPGAGDGNNYSSGLSITSQVLKVTRNGLSDLTVTIDKTAVGLSNVDNTSDAGKPISTAQAAVNALKVNATDTVGKWVGSIYKNATKDSIVFIIGTTRYAIKDSAGGAGGYTPPGDNTKLLDGTGAAVTPNKALVGLSSVDNTSDASKPVSTAQAAAIAVVTNSKVDSVLRKNDSTVTIYINGRPTDIKVKGAPFNLRAGIDTASTGLDVIGDSVITLIRRDSIAGSRLWNIVGSTRINVGAIAVAAPSSYIIAYNGSAWSANPRPGSNLPQYTNANFSPVFQSAYDTLAHVGAGVGTFGGKIHINSLNGGERIIANGMVLPGHEHDISPYSQIIVEGDGRSTVLYDTTTNGTLFEVKNGANILFRDFEIITASNAGHAILANDNGANDSCSWWRGGIYNVMISHISTSKPAVLIKNPFFLSVDQLEIYADSQDCLVFDNTSPVTAYGNSEIGKVIANPGPGKKALSFLSSAGNGVNIGMLNFRHFESHTGAVGIYSEGVSNSVFDFIDLESGGAGDGIQFTGTGARNSQNVHFKGGYIGVAGSNVAIKVGNNAGGLSFKDITIEGGGSSHAIADTSQYITPNVYDLILQPQVSLSNNYFVNPDKVDLTFRLNNGAQFHKVLPPGTLVKMLSLSDSTDAPISSKWLKQQSFFGIGAWVPGTGGIYYPNKVSFGQSSVGDSTGYVNGSFHIGGATSGLKVDGWINDAKFRYGGSLPTAGSMVYYNSDGSQAQIAPGTLNQYLTWSGGVPQFVDPPFAKSIGTVSGTSTANALDLTLGVLTAHYADATNPGVMKKYTSTGSNTNGTMDQNSITTALAALPHVVAFQNITGAIAGNQLSYTTVSDATVHFYRIEPYANITTNAGLVATLTCTITFKDENNASASITLAPSGSNTAAFSALGPSSLPTIQIAAYPNTAINVQMFYNSNPIVYNHYSTITFIR